MLKGFHYEITQDDCAYDPLKEYDQLGEMICAYRRYTLGHRQEEPEVIDKLDREQEGEWLPLYLCDHSGLAMSTTPFSCPWDSGRVGSIHVSKEQIVKEYGDDSPENRNQAKACMEIEVETYSQYLAGSVYCYTIYNGDDEVVYRSGIYGLENAEAEAQSALKNLQED